MRRPAARSSFAHVAALLAVALLTLAGVRSVVMQAAMAQPASSADCGMPMGDGMAMAAAPPASPDAKPGKAHATCAFCAAAHAPLAAQAPALSSPTVVAWTPAAPAPSLGARGPPAFAPRARGPPVLLLT